MILGVVTLPLAGQTTFIRAYSNFPFSQSGLILPEDAIQMSDGTYVFSAYDGYLVHTNGAGVPIQTLRLRNEQGGVDSSLNLDYLAQAGPDQVFVAGNTSSDTLFVLKIALDGTLLWQRCYRTPDNYARAILATPDGGVLVLASTARAATQSAIPVLTHIDANGNLIWQRRYFNANPGSGRMNWYGLSRTADGDYLVTGTTTPAAPQRILVARLTPSGVVRWARELDPLNSNNQSAVAVAELTNGEIKAVVNYPVTGSQFGIVRLGATGSLLGSGAYSGSGADVYRASILADGSLIATFTNLSTVARIAPDGVPVFARTYDLQNNSVLLLNTSFPTADGGLLSLGGYTFSFFGDFACTLLKTAADGLLPPGFHTPVSLTQQAYNPGISNVSLGDSAGGALISCQIRVAETRMVYDTLLGTPPLALEALEAPIFYLGPNPATETLRLMYDGGAEAAWRILDLRGRVLTAGVILPGQHEVLLPVTALAPGRYVCEVRTDGKRQGVVFIKP
jgi:hypothetical protein